MSADDTKESEYPWMVGGQNEEKDHFPSQPFGVMDDGTPMVSVDELRNLVKEFREDAKGYTKVSAAMVNRCADRLQDVIDKVSK